MAEATPAQAKPNTAAGRYEQLSASREPFLLRARDASMLTIPALMPPMGHTNATILDEPFQSVGADGVNNLSSKLLIVLWPPGGSSFRLTMDDFVVEELAKQAETQGQAPEDARATFETALGKVERAVTNRMEQKAVRPVHFEALAHLVVCGNALIHILEDGAEKFFPLDRYVVKRDLDGDILEIVIKESIARMACPADVQAILSVMPKTDADKKEENVDIYTWVIRQDDQSWRSHQEVEGQIVPGTDGLYPKGKSAFVPLRWRAVSGEDYGRGRCEEYIGDLRSLESLTESMVRFGIAAGKVLFLVDENGVTDAREASEAESGDFIPGRQQDITAMMLDKGADFSILKGVADGIQKRLEKAFLMASSVQRDAERVTAEEIRQMINQLEEGLGGIYSTLASEFQLPVITRQMHQMQVAGKLPKLPDTAVAPQIVAGLEGLGRNADLTKLDALVNNVGQVFGQEALAEYVNVGAYMQRRAAALGIDVTGLVRTTEEVEQKQQQAAEQSMKEKTAPALIGAAQKGAEMQHEANMASSAQATAPAAQ